MQQEKWWAPWGSVNRRKRRGSFWREGGQTGEFSGLDCLELRNMESGVNAERGRELKFQSCGTDY